MTPEPTHQPAVVTGCRIRPWGQACRLFALVCAIGLSSLAVTAETRSAPTARAELTNEYCVQCHNDELKIGNFSLVSVDLDKPEDHAAQVEKILLKLRSGMMPPEGMPRPEPESVHDFVTGLEMDLADAFVKDPNPGRPVLHRLNRFEYARVVRQLLNIEIDSASMLPPDDMSMGYANMSDVLTVSPTLLEAYMVAAGRISRLAVGDPGATPVVETHVVPVSYSQLRHVSGTPFGTRGGIAVTHNFPADGEYVFRASLYFRSLGPLFGDNKPAEGEQLEVAVDGVRIALFDIERKMKVTEDLRSERVTVTAGPHRISASFVQRFEGPVQDFVMPFEQATADLTTGNVQGLTGLPHLRNLAVDGPYAVTGVSETPSRGTIFTCRPEPGGSVKAERECAAAILGGLARRAFRRPIEPGDVDTLLGIFDSGRLDADFDSGIRVGVQAILSDPEFLFRFERSPEGAVPGQNHQVSDLELASRLSFFLWSTVPDDELIELAAEGRLSEPAVLETQALRMLADPRAEALSTHFAAHWLHLQNLKDAHPDVFVYYDWDHNLTDSMRHETERLFDSVVREDRDITDLLTADYTFVDRRLAKHYGYPKVLGNRFRRVSVSDPMRRGILGHGSILTLTSVPNRTSPVIRGAWILDVLLGTPPPRPPANVPPLKENKTGEQVLSVRERLTAHRANPACSACHNIMDPLGYSLENFDAVGAFRSKDHGFEIDPSGTLFDGTHVEGPIGLRKYLLQNETLFVRNFTRNLLMYGLGRIIQPYDMPTVRTIAEQASAEGNRFSSFVMGIVNSVPFQMRRAEHPERATEIDNE